MKISFTIILYVLISCISTNEMLYKNSYNYLLENEMNEIQQFVEEESGSDLQERINLVVSNEIVDLEAIFFESKSSELSQWEVFEGITNIKDFLWDFDSENSFDSFTSESELVETKNKSSNLVLFFSRSDKGLLLAELIWVPEQVTSKTKYKEVAMFGRSLRFLFEISDSNEVKNIASMEIHHN